MHIPDSWYTFGMEFPFRSTGKRNLKTISEQYHTLKEWQARREVIRQGILKGAQLFPLPKRTPLNVVTHSYRELNGYSVENVFFESVPGFFVSGNLYRPLNIPSGELLPVISGPHGHEDNARFLPDYQNMNATLSSNGCSEFYL